MTVHVTIPLEDDRNAEFLAAVEEGIAAAQRGELIAHEDVVREMHERKAKLPASKQAAQR